MIKVNEIKFNEMKDTEFDGFSTVLKKEKKLLKFKDNKPEILFFEQYFKGTNTNLLHVNAFVPSTSNEFILAFNNLKKVECTDKTDTGNVDTKAYLKLLCKIYANRFMKTENDSLAINFLNEIKELYNNKINNIKTNKLEEFAKIVFDFELDK